MQHRPDPTHGTIQLDFFTCGVHHDILADEPVWRPSARLVHLRAPTDPIEVENHQARQGFRILINLRCGRCGCCRDTLWTHARWQDIDRHLDLPHSRLTTLLQWSLEPRNSRDHRGVLSNRIRRNLLPHRLQVAFGRSQQSGLPQLHDSKYLSTCHAFWRSHHRVQLVVVDDTSTPQKISSHLLIHGLMANVQQTRPDDPLQHRMVSRFYSFDTMQQERSIRVSH
mmetsp:Transcript_52437/g.170252  ORF Transcript_52437/g.170252 Transcript_52437/m.170252 type:complete len:225 (+) Transcript_52437:424-1098(+)